MAQIPNLDLVVVGTGGDMIAGHEEKEPVRFSAEKQVLGPRAWPRYNYKIFHDNNIIWNMTK